MKVLVTELCLTLCNPVDCSPSDFSPWDFPGRNPWVGCHLLLQGIVPTQKSNLGLLHCRWIIYQLSYNRIVPLNCCHMEKKHQCYITPLGRSREGSFWSNVRKNFKSVRNVLKWKTLVVVEKRSNASLSKRQEAFLNQEENWVWWSMNLNFNSIRN